MVTFENGEKYLITFKIGSVTYGRRRLGAHRLGDGTHGRRRFGAAVSAPDVWTFFISL